MCDIRNMTNEELQSLTNRILIELNDRKNKEKNALLKTFNNTIHQLYDTDPNFYMNSTIRTDCCGEEMEIDLFRLLLDYFDIY